MLSALTRLLRGPIFKEFENKRSIYVPEKFKVKVPCLTDEKTSQRKFSRFWTRGSDFLNPGPFPVVESKYGDRAPMLYCNGKMRPIVPSKREFFLPPPFTGQCIVKTVITRLKSPSCEKINFNFVSVLP